MKGLIVGLGLALLPVACADAAGPSDYDAGAVIRGTVQRSTGEPVEDALIQVGVFRAGCGDEPIQATGGGVFTDGTGRFEGDFRFLSDGPVIVECLRVEVVDTLTAALLGDTLVAGDVRFDAVRSDTLELDMEV